MLDSNQRNAGIKIPCLTTWRMPKTLKLCQSDMLLTFSNVYHLSLSTLFIITFSSRKVNNQFHLFFNFSVISLSLTNTILTAKHHFVKFNAYFFIKSVASSTIMCKPNIPKSKELSLLSNSYIAV